MLKTLAKIICFVLAIALVISAIGLLYEYTQDSSTDNTEQSGDSNNTQTPDTPSNPTTPADYEYTVEYLLGGDATNLSDLSLTGDRKAKEGETVTFKITIGDSRYSIASMSTTVWNSSEIVAIQDNGDYTYSFTMPKGNMIVWVYFQYTPEDPYITLYNIGYDSLGWASMSVVNLSCPDKAAANETVTFTATIKPEYADQYYISGITVQLGSGATYIQDLKPKNGTYTFNMPDSATMEDDINEGYVTLLFYILPIDM